MARPLEESVARQPTLREAKRKLTRDRLVAAATATFQAKHYADVTVEDICDRAGTSRATFYLYFVSRAEILSECLHAYQAGLGGLWDQFEHLERVDVTALRAWLAAYVRLYEEHQLLLGSMHQAEAVEPEFRAGALARVKDTIARWRRLDVVRAMIRDDEDLELRLLLFMSELERFLYLWIVQGIEVDRERAISKLAEHWYEVLAD